MDNNSRQALAEVTPNWPEVLSKTIDDLSRIARTEMELLVAKLGLLLEAQTDKIAGMLFLIVALSYGSLFLLGLVAFFFDHWCGDCHGRGFLSDDDEGSRQEKGSLSAIAVFIAPCSHALHNELGEHSSNRSRWAACHRARSTIRKNQARQLYPRATHQAK
jgi:hypothetical protein